MSDLVSVLIPTRERPDTLEHALRTVVNQTYKNLEIIVSDNASGPATRAVVEAFRDPRIRYVNTGRRVNMTDNFEFALSQVTGEWIVVIGDDDGILPSGIERGLIALKASGMEALASDSCNFLWPRTGHETPKMYFTIPARRGCEIKNAKEHLSNLLRLKARSFHSPMLYTGGITKRTIIDRFRNEHERFFLSRTPDIFSVFAICNEVENFLFMREPIMISGVSKHSTGNNIGGKSGALYEQEPNLPFHEDLALEPGETLSHIPSMLLFECHLQAKRFKGYDIIVDACEHLAMAAVRSRSVARTVPEYDNFFSNWRRRFAKLHQVNEDDLERMILRVKWYGEFFRLVNRVGMMPMYYHIYRSYGLPYKNVFDVSVVAEDFLTRKSSILKNMSMSVLNKLLP